MPTLKLERIYTKPFDFDGDRILVDQLWARGMSKQDAQLDDWCKDIAPSTELRQWFQHDDAKFPEFKRRYDQELADNPATKQLLKNVAQALKTKNVILLYGAKNTAHNNGVVLFEYLQKQLHLTEPSQTELLNVLYNDGCTNHDTKMLQAVAWLATHPELMKQWDLSLASNDKIQYNNKIINHQQFLTLVIKNKGAL